MLSCLLSCIILTNGTRATRKEKRGPLKAIRDFLSSTPTDEDVHQFFGRIGARNLSEHMSDGVQNAYDRDIRFPLTQGMREKLLERAARRAQREEARRLLLNQPNPPTLGAKLRRTVKNLLRK